MTLGSCRERANLVGRGEIDRLEDCMESQDSSRSRRQLLGYAGAGAAATAGLFAIAVCSDGEESAGDSSSGTGAGVTRVGNGQSIQKAIDGAVAGTTILLEPGDYTERLELGAAGITLAGSGRHSTRLITDDGDLISLSPDKGTSGINIRDLALISSRGGGHVMNVPFGLNQSVIQRVRMIQLNDGKSLLHCVRDSPRGGLFDNRFTGCYLRMPTTSKVPGFHIVGVGNPASANLWDNCRAQGGGTYLFHIESGKQSFCYNNTFEAINFEIADNGGIRILGGLNTSIQAIGLFDNRVVRSDPITFGKAVGGNRSQSNLVSGYHRSGGRLASGVSDISFAPQQNEGTSTIINPGGPTQAGVVINCGNGDVTIIGHDPGSVSLINSKPSRTTALSSGSGLQVPKARVGTADYLNGLGSPEGRVAASVGAMYTRRDGRPGKTLYVKESGTSTTGWQAK